MKRVLRKLFYSAKPAICMDVAVWASRHGYPQQTLYGPVMPEIAPHVHGDAVALGELQKHRAVLERPQSLVIIERAVIRDAVGLVELPDGQICYEGNWWLPYLQAQPAYQRRFAFKHRKLSGNIYSLLGMWSSEFYHWFHDVLPRLETVLPELPPDTRFLLNQAPKAWQLDSLSAYGITSKNLEIQANGLQTKVERLWFATPVGHTSLGSGAVALRVARRLIRHFGADNSHVCRRGLYVSRRKAAFRRVVNEREFEPILKKHGYEIILCEELKLSEQVRLFANAKSIIGPHGAGLINMIYMPAGGQVAEIALPAGVDQCHYLVLAKQLGNHFTRLEAMPVGDDFQIDVNAVAKWADQTELGQNIKVTA